MPPDVSDIPDSEIISLLGLDAELSPKSEVSPEAADVEHGREVKPSHSVEDSSADLDTADHEGEDDEEEPVHAEDDAEEEPEEPDEGADEEEPGPKHEEVLEPAALTSLKTENEDLKKRLETAAPIVLTPTEDNPLADLTTEAQVMARVKQMRSLRDWCFSHLQGGEVSTKDGQTVELSSEQVGLRLSRAEAIINDYAPDRLAYLKELHVSREAARKIYPQLFDSKSDWSKLANSYISRHPAMLQDPNYEMVIGDAIAGMQARIMKAKTQKQGAGGGERGAQIPRALKPNVAPSSKGSVTKSQKARNDFLQTGNKRDLEAMILATL